MASSPGATGSPEGAGRRDHEQTRDAVVREARTWIGTPYHHRAAVKGAGVDCARLLIEVYAAAGVFEGFDPGDYPPDWFLHRDEERYVETILRFADEFDPHDQPILPADVVVWKFGRTFSHGGIVTAWPTIVHAFGLYAAVDETDVRGTLLETLRDGQPRAMRAFRPRGA